MVVWSCVPDKMVLITFFFLCLADPGVRVSSELVASVQSLVAVLQQQIHTGSHQEATHTQEVRSPQETRLTHHLPNKNVGKYFIHT